MRATAPGTARRRARRGRRGAGRLDRTPCRPRSWPPLDPHPALHRRLRQTEPIRIGEDPVRAHRPGLSDRFKFRTVLAESDRKRREGEAPTKLDRPSRDRLCWGVILVRAQVRGSVHTAPGRAAPPRETSWPGRRAEVGRRSELAANCRQHTTLPTPHCLTENADPEPSLCRGTSHDDPGTPLLRGTCRPPRSL